MMIQLLQTVPLSGRSFFQKLFGQYPEENGIKEINNLLASRPLLHISKQDIESIESKYGIDIKKAFRLNLEEFYAVYLNYCLQDGKLGEIELRGLRHLKIILDLDDQLIDQLHIKLGEIIYRQRFTEALSDGRLTELETNFLNELETQLRLPKPLVEKISAEARRNYMTDYVSGLIADQRISPDEEQEMKAIAASLNVDIIMNEKDKVIFEKLRQYWALENLELERLHTNIALQKNENCYVVIRNADWYELRVVRQRVNYSGFSTSFRIAKGFYLRSGSTSSRTYSTEEMKQIDTGTVYLTNKRILFTGTKKNSNIKLDKILQIQPYTDGVEIRKETGKSPLLILPAQADVFCIILERLLRERNDS